MPSRNLKPIPPQLIWAIYELSKGVKEIPGKESHPRIIEYNSYTTLKATDDEIAWCSAAMNCCMAEIGLYGTNSASSRSWLGWGKRVDKFEVGCIVVLWREKRDSWKGHVGIGLAEDDATVTILGGNQGNSFSVAKFPKDQVLSYRVHEDPDLRR